MEHNGTPVTADLSQLRTSGDIDIWIDPSTGSGTEGTREEILKFAESQGRIERIVYQNVEAKCFLMLL